MDSLKRQPATRIGHQAFRNRGREHRSTVGISPWGSLICLVAGLAFAQSAANAIAAEENADVLLSDSFEDGEDAPAGWEEGAPVPGVRYLWTGGRVADGERALSLKKTANRYFPIAQWTRMLDHTGDHGELSVTAQVKARRAGKAIIDVQFIDDRGKWSHEWACYIGAKDDRDSPATHDWKEYTGTVAIPAGTERIAIGLQMYGPGQVWFDQLQVAYGSGAGKPRREARPEPAAPQPVADTIEIDVKDGAEGEYLLVEPTGDAPADGYPLVIVLPGGDGSADFHPFVRRIGEVALEGSYLVAQPLARKWTGRQQIVWPTRTHEVDAMKYSTEGLIASVIDAVAGRHQVDRDRIYLLAWSSGGSAAYATLLAEDSPAAGGLLAMSVFKPSTLPMVEGARGKAFYLLHSPDDRVCPYWMATAAEKALSAAGGRVTLENYQGGHGWRGDVFGNIARGIRWLDRQ